MSLTAQSPISLTILRRGDMLLVDVPELGSLIPRSETQVDDAFLHELAAEVSQLATPGYGRNRAPLAATVPPVREPARVVQELQRIGGLIFSHLFTEPVRTRLRTAEPCDLYLRLDEQLIQVPWELGFDGEHFLATKFRIGRQVITGYPLPVTRTTRITHDTLKVLLIADPTQSLPQARAEAEQLYAFLEGMAGVKVTLMGGKIVRKLPLLAALQDYEVVHFAGHSEYDPTTPHKSGWRLHEGILTAAELSKLTRPPQLVFSNSCQAGTTAAWQGGYRYEGQAFGIGSAFLLAGVPNYIGTFWEVADEESVGFAVTFYRSLAAGQTLGGALHDARQATLRQSQGQGLTWASYMLYGNPTTSLLPGHNDAPPHPVLASAGSETIASTGQPTSISVTEDSRELLLPQTEARTEEYTATVLSRLPRKLAAILSADVAGYSRLMGEDEEATIRTLAAYQGVMRHLIQQHRGRVVDAPGDNMLAEFASVVDAVRCATEIQQGLKTRNTELPFTRQMEFRIGINLGDVIVDGEKLYGDGVNIAARLEALAEPGGICISGTVYDQVENKLALGYEYIGEQAVKNIAKPVRVYRVRETPRMPASPIVEKKRNITPQYQRWAAWAVAALLLLGVGIVAVKSLPWRHTHDPQPLPDKPSIAVLPFHVLNAAADIGYLGLGIPDAIITQLANIKPIRVRPTRAILPYEKQAGDPQQLGQALKADHVLDGTIQQEGKWFHVNVQLIRVRDGDPLWGAQYDMSSADLRTLQETVAGQIIAALRVHLTTAELARLRRRYTENAAAYELYLQGRAQQIRYTKDSTLAAIEAYESAVQLDPAFALAYAGLATVSAQWRIRFAPEADVKQWEDRAKEAARHALELDPQLGEAHEALAAIYRHNEFDMVQTVEESTKALELNPNLDLPHIYRAGAFFHLGVPLTQVEDDIYAAMEMNPGNQVEPLRVHGTAALFYGQFAKAVELLEAAQQRSEALVTGWYLAQAYYYQGQHEKAETMLRELHGAGQVERRAQVTLASFLAARSARTQAEALLGAMPTYAYVDHHVAYSLGVTHGQLGNRAEALHWLRHAANIGFPCYPWFVQDPLLEPLRSDPDFQQFLAELRTAWEETKARYALYSSLQ